MPPDIEQHIALMSGTLLLIAEILRRLLKRKSLGNLRLTVSVTDENSNDCLQNTNLKMDPGQKMDSNAVQQQQEKQQRDDDNA